MSDNDQDTQQVSQQSGGRRRDKSASAVPHVVWAGFLICLVLILLIASVIGNVRKDVSLLKTDMIALTASQSVADEALASGVAKVRSRLDKRVQAENDPLFAKWQAIQARGGDDSELGQKSEKEVKKLLTNGIWDIEPAIVKEYDKLMEESIDDVGALADTADKKAKTAQDAADNAQITANVSIRAAEIIARPTRPLHHSVSKSQKTDLQALLEQYHKDTNN
ncbi:MAG: hypothetical protein WC668_00405 [Patescibacteria group bacterium]|jgi:hypothetical protein